MEKKDIMLEHIKKNVGWFMTTTAAVEVIPYDELSKEVFCRAQQYFAKSAEYEDVVCLISTSIMQLGKSGILFTTDYVYSKAWGGIFTGWYKNCIHNPNEAEFDVVNEFDPERMKVLMADLSKMANQYDEEKKRKEQKQKIEKTIGGIFAGAQFLADFYANVIQESGIDENNRKITGEAEELIHNEETETSIAVQVFEEFKVPIQSLIKEYKGDVDRKYVKALRDIWYLLQCQAEKNMSTSEDDDFKENTEWQKFWALSFVDEEEFEKEYGETELEGVPQQMEIVMQITERFLDEETTAPIYEFANHIMDNLEEMGNLMNDGEYDEEFTEAYKELLQENIGEVEKLYNSLKGIVEDLDDLDELMAIW